MTRSMNRMMSRRGMVAGSVGSIVAAAAVAVPASCSGQVYPGARAAGIDLAGATAPEAEARLRAAFSGFEELAVTYTFGSLSWRAGLADLGVAIDYPGMVDRAMRHGRDGSLLDRYAALAPDAPERDVPLLLDRYEGALRAVLADIGHDVAIAARDARLELRDGEVAVVDHIAGRELDIGRAVADTNRAIETGEPAMIELATVPVEPAVTSSDLEGAREDALRLVSRPIVFTYEGTRFPVDMSTLTAALAIDDANRASLDPAALAARLDAIAAAVQVPARNVMLGWDGGLFVVEGDVDGVEVDREALEAKVLELAASDRRESPLPVRPVRAEARADNLEELGIEAHIATGSSSFAGSSAARAENVAVSARNISYKLVPPGGEFSFNELLGPITPEQGFVEGTIIQGDFAATDIGGGVCQVSTTVFRAAALAGFQFTEWHPHSWRLAFYEADGSPPGFDGAIYQSEHYELDLRFTNPLDSWLLLQVLIDGDTVAAHVYGRPNGWRTELGEVAVSEPKPIPDPVERENPDLAPGERRRVQQARPGVTVRLPRRVTAADGTVVSDGDFVSDYRSVPEAWEVGPR